MSAITLQIDMTDLGAREGIGAVLRGLANREEMNDAAGRAVEMGVKEHLTILNSRSPNTNFYARAADSTMVAANNDGATVSITERGMALRFYGGRVVPGKSISSFTGKPTRAISIASPNVPLSPGREGRIPPRDAGILAFIPSKKEGTIGVLVEGEEKTITRGPRKGGMRNAPKAGGRLMYVLRSWTDHQEDPGVIPSEGELAAAATTGIVNYLAAIQEIGGEA